MFIYSLQSAFLAMMMIVSASNYLVQFPINDWLTFGAFTYPFSFLVTELTNRFYGPKLARQVVYVGFSLAVLLSAWLATPKIAFASGSAFLVSQLLDIFVFNRFRQSTWWYAPFFSSLSASIIDTALFWNIAFWGEQVPLLTWVLGDFGVKLLFDVALLTPFRFAIRKIHVSSQA
jgi:queuosine precursor transporter